MLRKWINNDGSPGISHLKLRMMDNNDGLSQEYGTYTTRNILPLRSAVQHPGIGLYNRIGYASDDRQFKGLVAILGHVPNLPNTNILFSHMMMTI